jgi:hypothetical protein
MPFNSSVITVWLFDDEGQVILAGLRGSFCTSEAT